MASQSEDVDVRCKQCGASMGMATVRSASARALQKMVWVLGRLLCTTCEDKNRD